MANEIGDKIRRLRKERGLTQSDLADRSGVSFGAIQNLEAGKRTPRADTIEMLAQALDVSPNKLLGEVIPSGATLSASAIPGPLTPADCAAVLLQLAEVSPERRAFVLGVLFDDASIVPDSLAGELPRLLSTFR